MEKILKHEHTHISIVTEQICGSLMCVGHRFTHGITVVYFSLNFPAFSFFSNIVHTYFNFILHNYV